MKKKNDGKNIIPQMKITKLNLTLWIGFVFLSPEQLDSIVVNQKPKLEGGPLVNSTHHGF